MKLHTGNCLEVMATMPDNSVDSIVTDPPYGISFMAKKWDYQIPSVEVWREALRVLKPGGHMLCACGTRTQHRMVCNIEDAGFEIRDVVSNLFSQSDTFDALWSSMTDEQRKLYGSIHQDNTVLWGYGSGFPKSLNIGKAIDKAAGAEREVVGHRTSPDGRAYIDESAKDRGEYGAGDSFKAKGQSERKLELTAPATDEAKQWDGWHTALKPAVEFFTLCRKPLSEKTVAANVLKWGTGGINIDGCRVDAPEGKTPGGCVKKTSIWGAGNEGRNIDHNPQGRFPANLIHDGSQMVLDLFPVTKSAVRVSEDKDASANTFSLGRSGTTPRGHNDQGSAARFFYSPKCSKKDRDGSKHPTMKPTPLMQYLCRLVTPPGGTVLDPFMGSGSTGKAALREGFDFIGIEMDEEYCEIAKQRLKRRTENDG